MRRSFVPFLLSAVFLVRELNFLKPVEDLPAVLEALRREDSYVVQVEVIRASVGCRARSVIPLLEDAAARNPPHDILRQTVLDALERFRQ
jgi:hypothetical protein